jgi:hypothetical protein
MIADTEYLSALIKAYVPEADQLSFDEAASLAEERDQAAAAQLARDGETQLHLEKACQAANEALDGFFETVELVFIGNL